MSYYLKKDRIIELLQNYRDYLTENVPGLLVDDEVERVDGCIRIVQNAEADIQVWLCEECKFFVPIKHSDFGECRRTSRVIGPMTRMKDWCSNGRPKENDE